MNIFVDITATSLQLQMWSIWAEFSIEIAPSMTEITLECSIRPQQPTARFRNESKSPSNICSSFSLCWIHLLSRYAEWFFNGVVIGIGSEILKTKAGSFTLTQQLALSFSQRWANSEDYNGSYSETVRSIVNHHQKAVRNGVWLAQRQHLISTNALNWSCESLPTKAINLTYPFIMYAGKMPWFFSWSSVQLNSWPTDRRPAVLLVDRTAVDASLVEVEQLVATSQWSFIDASKVGDSARSEAAPWIVLKHQENWGFGMATATRGGER